MPHLNAAAAFGLDGGEQPVRYPRTDIAPNLGSPVGFNTVRIDVTTENRATNLPLDASLSPLTRK